MITKAPFETFREHAEREASGEPYNEAFINCCRGKALEYDKLDVVLRAPLLRELKKCVPLHYQGKVFNGIASFD